MANIVMIDDDKQLLHMMSMMLQRGGHEVIPISDPEEGLAYIKANRPDLLILDVMMPNMSGHALCRQVRATASIADLPVLILTARAQEIDRETALLSGADGYLSKPVTADQLLEQVDELLTKKRPGARSTRAAMVVSLFGLRGGVGRTTLAVNLAASLRRHSQVETCLVDLSPSVGQTVFHLRMQPRPNWAEIPTGPELVWEILARRLLVHKSGLRLLAAPADPRSPGDPSPETVMAIIDVLRQSMVYTVIDLPAVFSPAVVTALQLSDIVFHVIGPEVIDVQTALRASQALNELPTGVREKVYVLNQTRSEAQLPVAVIERGLGARLVFKVGFDNSQSRALAQGMPLALTTSQTALPTAVHRLAQVIMKQAEQAAAG